MSEQFLNFVRNCSKSSKTSMKNFLSSLLSKGFNEVSSEQSQFQNQHFQKLSEIFNKIAQKFSIQKSRSISKEERSKKMLTNHEYNYGQMTFKTIYKIIKKLRLLQKLEPKSIFYDLGSGSGKVVFGAGLCYPFLKCNQLIDDFQLKQQILSAKQDIQGLVNQCTEQFEEYRLPTFELSNSDFKTVLIWHNQDDWSDATVVFLNSTCYSRQLMHQIGQMSQNLQPSTILITLTTSINNPNWKIIDKFEGETSWGTCTIYLHEKDKQSLKKQKF